MTVTDVELWTTPDAEVVMSAQEIRTDRTRWLEARKLGVGGSDLAALMGEAKYGGSEYSVWLDKTGRTWELDASEAMDWGVRLEDVIAQAFAEQHGLQVRTSGLLRSRTHPHALASGDRLVSDGGGLECKNHNGFLLKQYRDEAYPRAFYWQMVACLAVTGLSHWWLAALLGGNHLEVRRLERADCRDDIAHALERIEAWWDYVERDVAPDDGAPADWDELLADSVEASMPELVLDDIARWSEILVAEKAMEAEKKEIQARMLSELGTHKALSIAGVPMVRQVQRKGSTKFDRARLHRDDPDTEAKYLTTGAPSRYPQLITKEAAA